MTTEAAARNIGDTIAAFHLARNNPRRHFAVAPSTTDDEAFGNLSSDCGTTDTALGVFGASASTQNGPSPDDPDTLAAHSSKADLVQKLIATTRTAATDTTAPPYSDSSATDNLPRAFSRDANAFAGFVVEVMAEVVATYDASANIASGVMARLSRLPGWTTASQVGNNATNPAFASSDGGEEGDDSLAARELVASTSSGSTTSTYDWIAFHCPLLHAFDSNLLVVDGCDDANSVIGTATVNLGSWAPTITLDSPAR